MNERKERWKDCKIEKKSEKKIVKEKKSDVQTKRKQNILNQVEVVYVSVYGDRSILNELDARLNEMYFFFR